MATASKRERRPKYIEIEALDAISDGVQEIVDLADEMRSWYDNLPESFQQSDRGERINEAADTLEYAEAQQRLDAFESALEAVAGKPEKIGCPEHLVGTPCAVCGWNGEPLPGRTWPVLQEYPEGAVGFENGYVGSVTYRGNRTSVPYVDRWSNSQLSWNDREAKRKAVPPEKIDEARVKLRKLWWETAEACARFREKFAKEHPNAVPKRIVGKPEVPGIEGFEEAACQLKIQLATGKRRPSRADRLSSACDSIRMGAEAVKELIDRDFSGNGGAGVAELLSQLAEAIDELVALCDDVDGVEFPGMYG